MGRSCSAYAWRTRLPSIWEECSLQCIWWNPGFSSKHMHRPRDDAASGQARVIINRRAEFRRRIRPRSAYVGTLQPPRDEISTAAYIRRHQYSVERLEGNPQLSDCHPTTYVSFLSTFPVINTSHQLCTSASWETDSLLLSGQKVRFRSGLDGDRPLPYRWLDPEELISSAGTGSGSGSMEPDEATTCDGSVLDTAKHESGLASGSARTKE